MARYIDAVNAAEIISDKLGITLSELVDVMATVPIADVQEVKHGDWLKPGNDPIDNKQWICSECKGLTETAYYCGHCYYNYCPNCGARMDGVANG
jgi:rubrerythrin|nr:MAG TPA: Thaumarchaeal output domain 1 [Caudoviricetes sp.]